MHFYKIPIVITFVIVLLAYIFMNLVTSNTPATLETVAIGVFFLLVALLAGFIIAARNEESDIERHKELLRWLRKLRKSQREHESELNGSDKSDSLVLTDECCQPSQRNIEGNQRVNMRWNEIKETINAILFWWTAILWFGLISYALLGILLLTRGSTGTPITGENYGLIGIVLALLSLGHSVLSVAISSRTATDHHNTLSEKLRANETKLNTVSGQLQELIAIVKSPPQPAPEDDQSPESLTDRVTAIEDTISRVKDSLDSPKHP